MYRQVVHVDADVVEGPLVSQLLQVEPELLLVDGLVEEHHMIDAHLHGHRNEGSNAGLRELALIDLKVVALGAPLSLLYRRLGHTHLVEAEDPEASVDTALQLGP